MVDLLVEIWSSFTIRKYIPKDCPPYSLVAVSSWNRYNVQIVPCIAQLVQILGLAFFGLFVQLSKSLALSRFLPAPLWGPRSRARLSRSCRFLCISIPAVAKRLSTKQRTLIFFIHFQLLILVMICWAIGPMIASSFHWMRGIFLRSIFFRLGLFCSASWVSRPRVLIAQQLLIECARYQRMLFFTCSYPIHCLILLD